MKGQRLTNQALTWTIYDIMAAIMVDSMDLDQWLKQQQLPSKNGEKIINWFVKLNSNIKRSYENAEKYLSQGESIRNIKRFVINMFAPD